MATNEITRDATPIVDAWARAIGGRDQLARRPTRHTRGTETKLGVDGTFEEWRTARDELRRNTELAGMRETTVFDGSKGWVSDANGSVIELDGPALHDIGGDPILITYSLLLQDRRVGRVTRADDDTLQLTADGDDRPIKIEFDPARHVPRTFTRRDGEHTRTIELADWREIDGLRMPWMETVALDGEPVSKTKVQQLDNDAAPAFAFGPLVESSDDVHVTAPNPIIVPMEIDNDGQLRIEASINGSGPLKFVLDTGGPTLIDSSRIQALGLVPIGAVHVVGINGSREMSFLEHVRIGLPGVIISDQVINTTSIASSFPDADSSIAGFLGFDLFSRFVIELDFASKTMRLHQHDTYRHAGTDTPIPLGFYGTTPTIEATLELPNAVVAAGRFLVDTGCRCDLYLTTPFTDQHRLTQVVPGYQQTTAQLGVATLPALVIGTHRIPEATAGLWRGRSGLLANPDLAGNIGVWALRRFRVVLDYKAKQMWLDPKEP